MSPLTLPVIARSAATKQSTLWRKIRSITVAVVQRSAIICLAEPLFGTLSTRRLTRASELSLKTTSELESVHMEVALNVLRVLALASIGEKSGARARTCVAGPKLDLRRHALMLALGLAPFAMTGQAKAACDPAAPFNNTTVTCTGTTSHDPFGYGTFNDTGNTYNILSGASVTGTSEFLPWKTSRSTTSAASRRPACSASASLP